MCEIKFRVWDNQFKQFCPDWFGDSRISLNQMFDSEDGRFIFQQFTGLRDKNSKEIYEGDILEIELSSYVDNLEIHGTVVFDERKLAFMINHKDYLADFIHNKYAIITVVGNIFENTKNL